MGVPKHRPSKARRDRRRKHHRVKPPQTVQCPHCGADKLPHRTCPECGKK